MITVRQRAIELAGNPETYDEDAAAAVFEEPRRAKLEADAYLALVINQVVDGMVQTDELPEKVINQVPERIGRIKPRYQGVPNSQIPPATAAHAFKNAFLDVYSYNYAPLADTLSDTVVGRKATAVGQGYAGAAESKLGALANSFSDHRTYREPILLLRTGLSTFSDMAVNAIIAANDSELDVEQRAMHLAGAERSLLGVASLSLNQALTGLVQAPVAENGRINLAPNIQDVRRHQPKSRSAEIRPHHGCPAMPSMPEAGNLIAGSPLGRLWQMTSKLIVAANVHALDSDAPEHAIFPQPVPAEAV